MLYIKLSICGRKNNSNVLLKCLSVFMMLSVIFVKYVYVFLMNIFDGY